MGDLLAAAGLLLRRFPLRPVTSKALESQGGFETIGFKRRFCILFVAVDKKPPPEAIEVKSIMDR